MSNAARAVAGVSNAGSAISNRRKIKLSKQEDQQPEVRKDQEAFMNAVLAANIGRNIPQLALDVVLKSYLGIRAPSTNAADLRAQVNSDWWAIGRKEDTFMIKLELISGLIGSSLRFTIDSPYFPETGSRQHFVTVIVPVAAYQLPEQKADPAVAKTEA